jgi:acetyl-CoA acyltransferase
MTGVVIVGAVRSPIGRYRGGLADIRADHLGAHVLQALVERSGIEANVVDDVIFGCVTQIGEQCGNVARTALLGAGWPEHIPGMTVDRKCGSAEAAIHTAVGEIASGLAEVVVAGGAESMTRVPMGSNRNLHGEPFGWRVTSRFALTAQGEAAERIADLQGFTREDLDDFAMESHRRAAAAADRGDFDAELAPISIGEWAEQDSPGDAILSGDETIRRDTSRERLRGLKSSFREDGRVTAGNSSQICDGAAALLLMSESAASRMGVRQRARIHAVAVVGSDPVLMLTGPIAATRKVLAKGGLKETDIDLFEINEAFAPVPMAWMKELGVGHDRLNVNGGAIGLGHPLGASGARIMTTLLHELERRGGRFGLQSICCAGGMATATIIERLP